MCEKSPTSSASSTRPRYCLSTLRTVSIWYQCASTPCSVGRQSNSSKPSTRPSCTSSWRRSNHTGSGVPPLVTTASGSVKAKVTSSATSSRGRSAMAADGVAAADDCRALPRAAVAALVSAAWVCAARFAAARAAWRSAAWAACCWRRRAWRISASCMSSQPTMPGGPANQRAACRSLSSPCCSSRAQARAEWPCRAIASAVSSAVAGVGSYFFSTRRMKPSVRSGWSATSAARAAIGSNAGSAQARMASSAIGKASGEAAARIGPSWLSQ